MGVLSPEHPENGKTPAPSSITDPECPPHALPRQLPVQGPAGGQPRAGKAELVGRGGRGDRLRPLDPGHKGAAQINLSASWCICPCLPSSYPLQSNNIPGRGEAGRRGSVQRRIWGSGLGQQAWGPCLYSQSNLQSPSQAPTQDDPHLRQESLPPARAQAFGCPAPPSQAAALTESRRLWNSVWVRPPSSVL